MVGNSVRLGAWFLAEAPAPLRWSRRASHRGFWRSSGSQTVLWRLVTGMWSVGSAAGCCPGSIPDARQLRIGSLKQQGVAKTQIFQTIFSLNGMRKCKHYIWTQVWTLSCEVKAVSTVECQQPSVTNRGNNILYPWLVS